MLPNEEPTAPESALPPAPVEKSGCLESAGWLAAAPVLACFSPTFYANVGRRRTGTAFLTFFVFTFVIVSLQTCGVVVGMVRAGQEIRGAFERGEFPEITITNGVAEVKGEQPFILEDNDTFLGIDTTGEYTEIDRRYQQGFLLKRTSLVVMNRQGDYQEVPLREVQRALDLADPFVINAETTLGYWVAFSAIVAIAAFLFLLIWNWVARIAYLALIGLLLWGVTAMLRPGIGFGPVISVGLHAVVPAMFAVYLLSQVSFYFPGLTTLFLFVFWGVSLAIVLYLPHQPYSTASFTEYLNSERPLRLWRAFIAVPLLIAIALDLVLNWEAVWVIWPLTFVTVGALLIVSFLPLVLQPKPAASVVN